MAGAGKAQAVLSGHFLAQRGRRDKKGGNGSKREVSKERRKEERRLVPERLSWIRLP